MPKRMVAMRHPMAFVWKTAQSLDTIVGAASATNVTRMVLAALVFSCPSLAPPPQAPQLLRRLCPHTPQLQARRSCPRSSQRNRPRSSHQACPRASLRRSPRRRRPLSRLRRPTFRGLQPRKLQWTLPPHGGSARTARRDAVASRTASALKTFRHEDFIASVRTAIFAIHHVALAAIHHSDVFVRF